MITMTSPSTGKRPAINHNCVLRRNVETQPYGRCSVCTLKLKQCHAWQSSGWSFALAALALTLPLMPSGWPQQLIALMLLGVIVWQGLANHKRTDDLIFGQHKLMALTQELRGKQRVIESQNNTLAAQVDARTAELRESNLRLAAANLELLELDKLRSAVLSNVSHELRTPLTGILGSAQNLRDGLAGGLTTAQQEYVGLIEKDSGRLIRVVNELLEWGRLQSGRIELHRSPVPLQPMLAGVAMLLRPVADRRGVRLSVPAGESSARIHADADKLRQIVINLVDNAVKFSPPGSCVDVRLETSRQAARILVEDQGLGVPPEDRPHVFERFYRGHGAHAAAGSGLGLAIAKNLARLHGGDITLQSGAAQGSVFVLSLPMEVEA
ncbi:MAG: HAMP domain-containing histidine kinase [Burkholderiales bacterium]|uniref:histidine kinase n=2 Tax=Ottowia TaxID=219181 RepID=A0ABV6PTE2_9BURK|nr:HAMP domain-containing histidine kinase [Burkholderiales bacterium]MBS0402326.1 HAMP domain-containing histidine kinase [Pseudomonadota bacterium]